jgi:drug/metabolite transporter (DMT)-like permease
MTDIPAYFLLPLAAGMLYAFSALLLKRSFALNAGMMRAAYVSNWIMGIGYLPLLLVDGDQLNWLQAAQACLLGLTFFLGQLFTFIAMRVGDVSVATPILGTKVLFVAIASFFLFGQSVPPIWWLGAAIAAIAILLLGVSDVRDLRKHALAILYAVISAAFFGLTDAMLPEFAGANGGARLGLVSLMFMVVALLSFALIPFFNEPLRSIPKRAWPWLAAGGSLLAVQSLLMAITLSLFGNPTAVNILYSGRGLWALLLVVWIGRWLQNVEGSYSRKTMLMRWLGALLLIVAILLVLLNPQ